MIDGGIHIHETVLQVNRKSTCAFIIIGPEQAQQKSGTELLKHRAFREEFTRFLTEE